MWMTDKAETGRWPVAGKQPTRPDDGRLHTTSDTQKETLIMYEIVYDYTDEGGYENCNNVETFEGAWTELQAYIKTMKKNGCYHITVTKVRDGE